MLFNRRASRRCTWGCCGPALRASTLRRREERQWRKDWKKDNT